MLVRTPKPKRQAVSRVETVPAPIGGWNARDSIADMRPTDAVYLRNWWPRPMDVVVRAGSSDWATGMTGKVETLMSYNTPSGTQRLFACANNQIYNVTFSGTVGAAETAGTITSNRWQYINVTTAGGSFLYLVNGADKPRLYDGTTWTEVDAVSTPAITGVTTTNLVHIWVHKNRIWFVERFTLKAWYLPVDALGGAAASFDLSTVCRRGGYLMAGGTWTIDGGDGVDDYQVFVTSEGEVLVYRGTDPASANTWALVGRWEISQPVGRRCLMKYAGDLMVICRDGVLPMSRALQTAGTDPSVAATDKIRSAITASVRDYASNFGWQLALYPDQNMLLLNVPTSGNTSVQYVMNTITRAWAEFNGWNAACFELHNNVLYFGTNGKVVRAWYGNADSGVNITADAKTAFNYFGAKAQKHFKLIRPLITSNGLPPLSLGLNFDFRDAEPASTISAVAPSGGVWDTAIWDADAWGGGGDLQALWQGVRGVGFCAALRMKYDGKNFDLAWASTDFVYERGGVL